MTDEFRICQHEQVGFALPMPAAGEVTEEFADCALVAVEPPGVTLEQWAVAHGGYGYVVSCTMLAPEYDARADSMAYIAEGLRIEGAHT